MRKGKRMLLFALVVGAMFVMTSCGNNKKAENTTQNQTTTQGANGADAATSGADNANAGTTANNEAATNDTNAGNNNSVTDGTNNGQNKADDGPLTNLGDDIMEGVDDLATDIGLDGNRDGADNNTGSGTGNETGMVQ